MTDININFSGASYTIYKYSSSKYQILGAGTLTSNYVISASGTFYEGNSFTFYFKATVDKATYNFNILGTNLSTIQLNRESTIEAVYNGTSWDLNIQPNTKAANWINYEDLPIATDYETLLFPVSFESGEQAKYLVSIPYKCKVLTSLFTCTKTLSGTDNGLIEIIDVGATSNITSINVPASTTINTTITNSSINYTMLTASTTFSIESTKTTVNGKGIVSITVQRI